MLNSHTYPMIHFPDHFIWGSATAAHQIEGDDDNSMNSFLERQRGYKELSGKACDSYRLYRDDVELLKRIGHKAYRFSIAWSRVEPVKATSIRRR